MSLNPTKGLKAVDENDEHIIRQVSTAELMVGMGQVGDAVAMLQQMLQERPENIQVHTKLKDIYLRSEMLGEAAQECLQLARIYEARGDSNRASDYLVRAKRLNPNIESKTDEEPPPLFVSSEAARAATDNSTVKVSLNNGVTEAPSIEVEPDLAREQAEKEHRPAAKVAPFKQPPATLIKEPLIKEPLIKESPVKETVLVKEPVLPAPVIAAEQSFITNDTALAPLAESRITSKQESSSGVALATRTQTDTGLSVKPISRLRTSQTKKRQSRWRKLSAIAAACLAVFASAAIAGLFAYDRYLDRQYATLVPVDLKQAPPSLPESYTEATTYEQQLMPSEQIEEVMVADPVSSPVERYQEEAVQEVLKPAPLPEPAITSPPPKESKPPLPAPPMIGRVNAGQGGFSNGAASLAPAGLPLSDAPPPPPQAVRKSSNLVRGRVLRRVEPTNPTSALSRLTGTVVVEVLVDERGNVASARALSGHPVLQNAALSAARRWKFEPSKLNGTLVQATGQITFNFK